MPPCASLFEDSCLRVYCVPAPLWGDIPSLVYMTAVCSISVGYITGYLRMYLLCPRAATRWRRHACDCVCRVNTRLHACHVAALPHGGVGLHVHIYACPNTAMHVLFACLPHHGYYVEAQARLYAHLTVTHLTTRQPSLACLHVGCVGFHHVASSEHLSARLPYASAAMWWHSYAHLHTFQHYRVPT